MKTSINQQIRGYGLSAISAAASSGSVVYTEWSLKSMKGSIHVQNAQLYAWGVFVNVVYFLSRDTSGHIFLELSHGRYQATKHVQRKTFFVRLNDDISLTLH
jgi:hypothetical protein